MGYDILLAEDNTKGCMSVECQMPDGNFSLWKLPV